MKLNYVLIKSFKILLAILVIGHNDESKDIIIEFARTEENTINIYIR